MMNGMHRIHFDDGDVRDLVLTRVVWRAGEHREETLGKAKLFLGLFDLNMINWRSLRRLLNNAAACVIGWIVIILGRWWLYHQRHHIPD